MDTFEAEGRSAEFLMWVLRTAGDGPGLTIDEAFYEKAREASRMVGYAPGDIERGLNAHPGEWVLQVANEYRSRNRRLSLAIIDLMDGTSEEQERALEVLEDIAAHDAIPSHRHAARAELSRHRR